ncbi:DUF1295 domain-containing protein [Flexilinea flocculi]|uniref:Steroid 5-alpha reductase family enzyme n=1 Tax=Flexilinea flocculi TaxID=1678840 RepID=A0A0S7BJE6_9CHLR|nr:DUF1295 domain-containing protein [Flexilinea flocculi]GAP40460.1 steroid 5-alpha reductase family enzyme [Flexilinea flocculi]
MMTIQTIFGINLAVILVLMIILWVISLLIKNSSIVDIFWGAGFVLSVWIYFFLTPNGFQGRKLLISILATIWGLRLATHIFIRNFRKPEDSRYQKFRSDAGKTWWWRSLFQVFLLQGLLLCIISTPLLAAQIHPSPNHFIFFDFLGVIFWMIGFFFEASGDFQLAKFRANPQNKGKILDTGVWRYTRHPNYFGDSMQWWGYFSIASAAGGWWTIFSPIIMTTLLVRVSGAKLLEKTMGQNPKYQEYIKNTPFFIPWIPKKRK